jgi:hypothetical protein
VRERQKEQHQICDKILFSHVLSLSLKRKKYEGEQRRGEERRGEEEKKKGEERNRRKGELTE